MNKTNTKKIRISKKWLLFGLMLFICVAATAYAAAPATTTPAAGTATNAFNEAMSALANMLVALLGLLKKILWPIFLLIGGLLNNDLLFGAGMEERILMIWTQIRNFVNIGFVMILVGVALYNVTGIAKEEFDLKKFLPKFAIALIAVNFSYIALKIVLDVTNVFTVAVFAMPKTISADLVRANSLAIQVGEGDKAEYYQRCGEKGDKTGCADCVEFETDGKTCKKIDNVEQTQSVRIQNLVDDMCQNFYGTDKTKFINTTTKDMSEADKEEKLYCKLVSTGENSAKLNYQLTNSGAKFFSSFTSNNAALILGIQFMNIVDVDKVSQAVGSDKAANFTKITMNLLFASLMYIVYGVAYVSMFILLLVRLVVLWLILILSPLMALSLAGIKFAEGGEDYKKMFIQHAIAPLKLAVVLTIGYMILEVFKTTTIYTSQTTFETTVKQMSTELSGISTLQSFVMAAAAVIFIWVGVKAAAKETKAGQTIDTLMGKVQQAGKTIGGLWRYAPVIPTGEGKSSYMQLRKQFNAPLEKLRTKYGGDEYAGEMTVSEIQALRGKGRNLKDQELREAVRKIQAGGFATAGLTKATSELFREWETRGTGDQQKIVNEMKEKIGIPHFQKFLNKGALPEHQKRSLQEVLSRHAAPAPTGSGARTTGAAGTTSGGATPPAAAPPTKEAGMADELFTALDKKSIGWENLDNDTKKAVEPLIARRNAAVSGNKPAEVTKVEGEMKKISPEFKKAVAVVRAAEQTKEDLTASASAVGGATEEIKGAQLTNLKTALENAKRKLVGNTDAKLNEGQIITILNDTLLKAGVKQEAINNTPDIKGLVQAP